MIELPSLITFIIYYIALVALGLYFYRRTKSIEDYLLGGRGLGVWVTAISAQASDMSGWLLMGLPGAVYLGGLPAAWIALGLLIGTACNWLLIAKRLRVFTGRTESITLPTFFERRFNDPSGLLRTLSALITLIFFTIYTSSGLVASGKLFESMFRIDYSLAVALGGFIIVVYTFLGGFLAVSWSDLLQGTLMIIAIVAVPAAGYSIAGGLEAIEAGAALAAIPLSLVPGRGLSMVAIVSAMAWGLGYFGQPHILARFMGIKSADRLSRSTVIALVWVVVSLAGAVAVGLIGIPLFPGLAGGEEEKVFIYLINRVFSPWTAGIMLAAILAAIMSTIDSQLLVSSSTLTEDFYQKLLKREASDRELVLVGRVCVVIISLIAFFLALSPDNTVLGLVAYAWAGFGAAFGPLVIFALFSRNTGWRAALAGMVTGTLTVIIWKSTGLGNALYEMVPGFAANCAAIIVVDRIFPEPDPAAVEEFDNAVRQCRG
ncbi:MAG: sodium/proline symporter PutP [Spirochaetes bacterium]|nr:sodium/proline symporter PutP [Spirochaetota bacterium]